MPEMEIIADGSTSFIEGQDASKNPDLIGEAAYALGVNVTAREGVLGPRWGMAKRTIAVEDGGITQRNRIERSYASILRTGKYQGSHPYTVGSVKFIVSIISGVIYFTDPNTYQSIVVPIQDGSRISENTDRVNIEVADKYLVIHDYPAYPVILDGFTANRSSVYTDDDGNVIGVPISTNGTYSQNRLFILNALDEFTAGDPKGSPATPDAPVTFEEVQVDNADYVGQVFSLPTGYNKEPVTAITFLPVIDTSTGIGPLLVSTTKQTFAFGANNPRSTWENGQFGSLFMNSPGIAGQRAFDFIQSDLIFMGADGTVRTLSMSRDQQNRWSKVSMSEEVRNWLSFWDKDLIKYAVVKVFRNKVFITANPYRTSAKSIDNTKVFDYAHGGMVVLELDNLTSFGTTSAPSWAGLWTGVRPMDIIVLDDRMFIFSKDNDRINTLYEVTPDKTYDTDGANIRQVRSVVETRDYFANSKLSRKELTNIRLGLEDVKGDFSLDIEYKPMHGESFKHYSSFSHQAPWRSFAPSSPFPPVAYAGHSFNGLMFGAPQDIEGSEVNSELYDTLETVRFRLSIEGISWSLSYIRILAAARPENETEGALNTQDKGLLNSVLVPAPMFNYWSIDPFSTNQEMCT